MSEPSRVVPIPDRDSRAWWDAVARHQLLLQRCDPCGWWRWPSRAMCGECGSFGWSWQRVVPTGRVVSWITTHHGFLPGFPGPYHTVFVRLHLAEGSTQDDVVMPGSWFGAEAPETGMTVRVHFDDIPQPGPEPVALVGWAPMDE
jgi:uncharacterized OB-fold protein